MIIRYNNKQFNLKIVKGSKEYVFVTLHGIQSNNTSWRYLEKWLNERATVINFDARCNGQDKKRASRMHSTYVRDLRDVVLWTKREYQKSKIIVIGSSWGAAVGMHFANKYSHLVHKIVLWSIPQNIFTSEEAKQNKEVSKKNNEGKIAVTSNFEYAWKLLVMLLFNINTKAYTKIDLDRTANNKTLSRMNKMKKPEATPVKLFYAAWKNIFLSWRIIKKINKGTDRKLLYIQSTKDEYATDKKMKFIRKNTGEGIEYIELDKGKHAFQWETKDDLYKDVFKMVFNFIQK
ncbi:MAG: alpha/beta hydrolase [Mycoplasma sp.]|nr:alpha/beta hydrolase [Mycoplasma sp.]